MCEQWGCVRPGSRDGDVCVPVCIHTADFFFCFHVSMWRLMVPGLDGSALAPVGLLRPASAQDQGVQRAAAAPSQPDCTPAAIP